jgi:hypothetical protein
MHYLLACIGGDKMKKINNSKVFEVEQLAKEYAEKVNGKVKMIQLPGYNFVEIIYVVERSGKNEEN